MSFVFVYNLRWKFVYSYFLIRDWQSTALGHIWPSEHILWPADKYLLQVKSWSHFFRLEFSDCFFRNFRNVSAQPELQNKIF